MVESSTNSRIIEGLVSIIIPAHQAEAFIERSVRSALNQTYATIEVIVVENGSTDATLEVTGRIKDPRLIVLQSEKGVSNARNKGIEYCKGEFMFFLDADDWLEQTAIESMMSVAEDDVDLISARYYGDRPFEAYDYYKYEAGSEEYIIKCLCTPTKRGNCTGNLFRTEFIRNHELSFNPELSHAEDTVFFTRFLVRKPVVIDMEKPVYHVFSNPESATRAGKRDNSDEFCKAILVIYEILTGCNSRIRNAGYICALNQFLVIMVNSSKGILELLRYLRQTSGKAAFCKAMEKADLSQTSGVMKLVYLLIKNKIFLPLAIVIKGRAFINSCRRKKEINSL